MKKLCSVLLCCAMLFAVMPAPASAASVDYSVLVSPQYDDARAFSCGVAPVRMGTKWGYINERGETAIPFQYDIACSFSENRAVVGIKKSITLHGSKMTIIEFGSIDMENKYYPFMLNDVPADEHPYYYVEIFNAENQVLEHSDVFFTGGYVNISDNAGITHSFRPNGTELKISSDNLEIFPIYKPSEGVIIATEVDGDGSNIFVDYSGKPISALNNLMIDYARPFNSGLAPVGKWLVTGEIEGFPTGESRWGFADKSGKLVIGLEYEDFYVKGYDAEYSVFNDGLASLKKAGAKWGAINRAGATKIPFIYDTLMPFSEGLAAFQQGGKWGFINTEGKTIIPAKFDDVSAFNDGLAAVRIGKTAAIINSSGSAVEGAQNIALGIYFTQDGENADGTPHYIMHSPSGIVVISENNKFGFAKINFAPDLPTVPDVNDWAEREVAGAASLGLIPVSLQNSYRASITRADFAALVIRAIEQSRGNDISTILKAQTGKNLYEHVAAYPFADTNNHDVIAARALGIINGVSATSYAPQSTISRQDAAAILMRTATFLGTNPATDNAAASFADSAEIASYAKESVAFVASRQIMTGTGDNKFSPRSEYTRQQAYITIYRLINSLA